jgi:hypothetical protein
MFFRVSFFSCFRGKLFFFICVNLCLSVSNYKNYKWSVVSRQLFLSDATDNKQLTTNIIYKLIFMNTDKLRLARKSEIFKAIVICQVIGQSSSVIACSS